jgi:hypothetical protein
LTTVKDRDLGEARNLCEACAEIDLDNLLSKPLDTLDKEGVYLGPVRKWKTESYPVCNMFHSIEHTVRFDTDKEGIWLHINSSKDRHMPGTWHGINTRILELGRWSKKRLVLQPEGVLGPVNIIKGDIQSFDFAESWIDLCQSQHTILCSVGKRERVPGLKLIDCNTGHIVHAEDNLYVALSYVWGASSHTSPQSNKLPEDLPNTISDAMTVTKNLGYQIHLDRPVLYCPEGQAGSC